MGFMDMFKKKDPKDLVREWQSKLRSEMRGVDRQIRGTSEWPPPPNPLAPCCKRKRSSLRPCPEPCHPPHPAFTRHHLALAPKRVVCRFFLHVRAPHDNHDYILDYASSPSSHTAHTRTHTTKNKTTKKTDIQREEKKVEKSIKDCAKRNDVRSMKLLAKEVISSRRTTARLYQNKAQMNSVSMMLSEQLATIKAVGHLTKSTEVLKCMNALVKNKQICETMREMSKEMMKSGLIEEMVNDVFEEANGVEDMEAETEAEVNKVLAEIAGEHMASMPAAEMHNLNIPAPAAKVAAAAVAAEEEEEEEDGELNSLQARLDAIRQAAS